MPENIGASAMSWIHWPMEKPRPVWTLRPRPPKPRQPNCSIVPATVAKTAAFNVFLRICSSPLRYGCDLACLRNQLGGRRPARAIPTRRDKRPAYILNTKHGTTPCTSYNQIQKLMTRPGPNPSALPVPRHGEERHSSQGYRSQYKRPSGLTRRPSTLSRSRRRPSARFSSRGGIMPTPIPGGKHYFEKSVGLIRTSRLSTVAAPPGQLVALIGKILLIPLGFLRLRLSSNQSLSLHKAADDRKRGMTCQVESPNSFQENLAVQRPMLRVSSVA